MESFQQKIQDRLIKDIGELLPDEALKSLIEKAIEKAFFKPQERIEGSGYHSKKVSGPSVFEEMVKKIIENKVEILIKQYISDNDERILKEIKPLLEQGIDTAIIKAFTNSFDDTYRNFEFNLRQNISNIVSGGNSY